jgi:hypothetical protein
MAGWSDLVKDDDARLATAIATFVFLVVHVVIGWPRNLPWWVEPLALIIFLFSAASIALRALLIWAQKRKGTSKR